MNDDARFWAKVVKPSDTDCWLWIASKSGNGYGAFSVAGRRVMAHRWSYEHFVGPIPEGKQMDHLCRNRACVNPAHLEPVTQHENIMRGVGVTAQNAVKTHCDNGHEFTPENTYRPPHDPDRRVCAECRREQQRRGWHRTKKRQMRGTK